MIRSIAILMLSVFLSACVIVDRSLPDDQSNVGKEGVVSCEIKDNSGKPWIRTGKRACARALNDCRRWHERQLRHHRWHCYIT